MYTPSRILRHAFWDATRPIRILTILMYPLAMAGLYMAYKKEATDVNWLFHVFPGVPEYCHALFWGTLILYIWIARIVGVFFFEGWKWTLRTTPMLGIIFWSCLLASNLNDPSTLAFGTLYGVCALMETWLLARNWLETA